jgi:hypothetical protein
MHVAPNFYSALATAVLFLHALFIVWVVFGALLTRSRPILRWLHIASLIWGILTDLLPWPCPLTFLENWLEQKAGVEPYQGGFLLHYLDKLVYPDVSATALTVAGVIVCAFNLALYGSQAWRMRNNGLKQRTVSLTIGVPKRSIDPSHDPIGPLHSRSNQGLRPRTRAAIVQIFGILQMPCHEYSPRRWPIRVFCLLPFSSPRPSTIPCPGHQAAVARRIVLSWVIRLLFAISLTSRLPLRNPGDPCGGTR